MDKLCCMLELAHTNAQEPTVKFSKSLYAITLIA